MERPQQHTLTKWGVNLAEVRRLNQLPPEKRAELLKKNLGTYDLHVTKNHPVSIPYHYWFSPDGRIFTNQEQTQELDLDPKERDGLYEFGLKQSFNLAITHPYQLIFLYSPPGPASFKYPADPEYAEPYDIGQLYLMYYDGQKINNLAVSINGEGEKWLKDIYNPSFIEANQNIKGTIEYIRQFITMPQLTDLTIDDFLQFPWENPQLVIFTSHNFGYGEQHQLSDVLRELRDSLTGKLRSTIDVEAIAKQIAFNGGGYISEERLLRGYQTIVSMNMQERGVNQIKLGGGCGGSTVRSEDLFNQNPIEALISSTTLANLSSAYRQIFQRSNISDQTIDYKNDPNLCRCSATNEPHFHCPGQKKDAKEACKHPIVVGKGITKCPTCGAEAVCK